MDGAWFLWYGTNFHWFISTVLGYPNPPGWESPGSDIFADYIGYGGAIGTAKVTIIYDVTGTMIPDIKGTYEVAGQRNNKPYYELSGNGWFIWWNGIDRWYITIEPGELGDGWWSHQGPDIEGLYFNGGTAIGNATVAEGQH